MKVNKMKRLIKMHYLHHGVDIDLIPLNMKENKYFIFLVKLRPGTKESLVFDRAPDIKTALQLPLFEPAKEGLKIYLAVSEKKVMKNSLWQMLNSQTFRSGKMALPIALGYDIRGKMVFDDLKEMPHVMYAGASNSGKSVGLTCLILSLIYKNPAQRVNLVLIDTISDTMALFDGIPHLSYPIIKDVETGIHAIKAIVEEMERRSKIKHDELACEPAIICVVDEYLSFLSNIWERKVMQEVEDDFSYILRSGRHVKIHMVLSTQDATKKSMRVDLNNISARVAFACAKYQDSITIIGEGGAEKLPGKGSLFYKSREYPDPIRLQGPFMVSAEVEQLVARVKSAGHDLNRKFVIPEYEGIDSITQVIGPLSVAPNGEKELAKIIIWILAKKTISVSQIKEQFNMGNRANEVMEKLFELGLVTGKFANQPRKVIPGSIEEIPESVNGLLLRNGFSEEIIMAAFPTRND